MNKHISILFVGLSLFFSSMAQVQLSDSAKISLMTTSPWSGAIYAVYGHTALFVCDDSTGVDLVFNYGFFDSDQPNFMYHFVRGETDYVLGVTSFNNFLKEYKEKKLEVVKQELNLTQQEKQNLWEALYINAKPENRGYRYNFLFDNCATRPRDMVEKYVQGRIEYPADSTNQTFRDLIHECVASYPWMEFGIDLIIGSGADSTINLREKMFLPIYLKDAFDGAKIIKNDTLQYNLVKNSTFILKAGNTESNTGEPEVLEPIYVALALLLLTIIVSVIQKVNVRQTALPIIYDTLLFGAAGIAGLIIFFLMFFSIHPAVNANWNFVWLNIFSLLFAFLFWVKPLKKLVFLYHFINFAVLTLFLALWWLIPQELPLVGIPFAMSLWIRSGVNIWAAKKKKSQKNRYPSAQYLKAAWGQ
ncbi:MAG: DUF4105 domain-containing protein [Dysgonamonadaceae bacterium]|jgi:hypothetical protein|nr:DUF4105 domain-containing protein [Dysgonamonadaceae bacterium]